MIQKTLLLAFAFLVLVADQTVGQELTDVKCIVSGEAAIADSAVDYRGGKVYLCCNHCVATFKEKTKDYATKANHQLLLTGQFVQRACPLTGGTASKDIKSTVGGVEVAFADAASKAKLEAIPKLEDKVAMIFADEAFEKAFALKPTWDVTGIKCFIMPQRDVKEAKSVDHMGGKVFFCCPGCVKKWNTDTAKYETQGNVQLVQSGQFKQSNCPISGGDVSQDHSSEIDGVKVFFCCEKCKAKVDTAADDTAKRELVFGKKSFQRGFAKK